jgi:hypothetical protein
MKCIHFVLDLLTGTELTEWFLAFTTCPKQEIGDCYFPPWFQQLTDINHFSMKGCFLSLEGKPNLVLESGCCYGDASLSKDYLRVIIRGKCWFWWV